MQKAQMNQNIIVSEFYTENAGINDIKYNYKHKKSKS